MTGERPLEHRVALVTGAAQGIGAAVAAGLAEQGARVVCGDLTAPAATADGIRAAGGQADSLTLDVTSTTDVAAAINFVAAGIGGLDILVNNAGVFPRSPALDLDEATWDRVLDVNLKGTFFCAQAAARLMVEQGRGGRIVNITSGAAFVPTPQSSHYAASKAG
ncbi:MAG: SDR family oxidoreductase, partial [Solirubrobacteraceae bacterium]